MSGNLPGSSPVSWVTYASPVIEGNLAGEHAFNIKFVGEIEKFPELYNYNLPQIISELFLQNMYTSVAGGIRYENTLKVLKF